MAAKEGVPCFLGAVVVCLFFNTVLFPLVLALGFFLGAVELACCSS